MAKRDKGKAEWFRDTDVAATLVQAEQLAASGIFNAKDYVVLMAGVTQLLIFLNDLLRKADADGGRIAFADDVFGMAPGSDVTDLIRDMRNAACHIPSGLRELGGNKLSFNVVHGYAPNAMLIGGVKIGCDYADDVAINYGGMRLYLVRHAFRALREVKEFYRPKLGRPAF